MSIQNFINNFEGGTRKNRFRVKMTSGPGYVRNNIDDFHIETAALPTSIITTNPIDYQGRRILYPGDRIYSGDGFNVWTMRVLDDLNTSLATSTHKNLWQALHAWSNSINNHETNTGNTLEFGTIIVEQLNLNDSSALKRATLNDCWPQSIGPIDFEMQARDQYNYFDVTFCFKYVKYEEL